MVEETKKSAERKSSKSEYYEESQDTEDADIVDELSRQVDFLVTQRRQLWLAITHTQNQLIKQKK